MKRERTYYVYIMTNKINTVLYTGQTIDLFERAKQYKLGLVDSFTKKYKLHKLVYYEPVEDREDALYREKQIKGYNREKKMALIDTANPMWEDLSDKILS